MIATYIAYLISGCMTAVGILYILLGFSAVVTSKNGGEYTVIGSIFLFIAWVAAKLGGI